MFRNQTPRLTAQPYMWSSLAILQTMFVDDVFNLLCSTAIGAERCEALGPAVQEDRLVEVTRWTH